MRVRKLKFPWVVIAISLALMATGAWDLASGIDRWISGFFAGVGFASAAIVVLVWYGPLNTLEEK